MPVYAVLAKKKKKRKHCRRAYARAKTKTQPTWLDGWNRKNSAVNSGQK